MEQNQELSVSTMTNTSFPLLKELGEGRVRFDNEDDEQLTGDNCPVCGYPIVIEEGLEVCYCCGWSKE